MSLLFYTRALALIDDIPLKEHYRTKREFFSDLDLGMSQVIAIPSLKSTVEF
jgi:hypothetical protein